MGAVVERLVSGMVGRRLSQGRVAALGTGLLGVRLGAAGQAVVSGQRRVLGQTGRMDGGASSPSQGRLLSLSVEGHVAT